MSRLFSPRVQTILVILLFVGALAILIFNTWTNLELPWRELQARESLHAAARELTAAAAGFPGKFNLGEADEELRKISSGVLLKYPGVEGGFFLAESKAFSAYAFPTSTHNPDPLPRNEPPPLEAPVIRLLALQCLEQQEPLIRAEDVESSRVVILAEPVASQQPARMAAWVMYRLTGPASLGEQVRRQEASAGLALCGLALALALTWNLGRTLRRQRREQDRLRDELHRSEHLAGLGRLLAGVAHEVRNPLAAVRSTVQLWQRQPDKPRAPETLDAIIQAVDRLNTLVSRLLFFARADQAERRPVDVNQILAESLELIETQATEQGVRLERDLARNLPTVLGSANALRQVILNLLTNALQAMPGGGSLRCASAGLPDGRVQVRIADTGPGVGEENQVHLFEPFFTTRPEGTGLGLALCREIVANHGGRIEYVHQEGAGATFCFSLPAGG